MSDPPIVTSPRPVTVCHRGASALAPENTLAAFALAVSHGVDMAELDVHLSRDGELMVIHDADLTRVAGRPLTVSDLTADELAGIDVGDGRGLPRLVEVFALVRGRMGIYVELKGLGTGTALGRLVTGDATSGVRLIAGSVDTDLLEQVRAEAPTIPRSVLFRPTPLPRMIDVCRAVGATYAHPCFRPVDRGMVDTFHDAGLQVMTPHSNDQAEVRGFAAIGVDVIASDDPRLLTRPWRHLDESGGARLRA